MSARLVLLQALMSSCRHHQAHGARVALGGDRRRPLLRAAAVAAAALELLPSTTSIPPPSFPRLRSCFPIKTQTSAFNACFLWQNSLSRALATSAFSCSATTRGDASTSASTSSTHADASDAFLAPPSVTFESLGLKKEICDALRASGISHPSAVQASAIPHLLSSSDAVLAAQTGSGKTIAYLAPLISRLLSAPALPSVADDDDKDDDFSFDGDNDNESSLPLLVVPSASDPPPSSLGILVLCPNAALCDQVVSVCQRSFDEQGLRVTAARVGGGGGGNSESQLQIFPSPPPDVTVATPAGLLAATLSSSSSTEGWSPAAVIRRTRAIVLDEADALLGGGYARDSRRVLEGMRAADEGVRLASARHWLAEQREKESIASLPLWRDLPQKARRAARDGGARALALELRRMTSKTSSSSSSSSSSVSFELPPDLPRRQYVFSAATMPEDPRMTEGLGDEGKASPSLRRKKSSVGGNSAPAGAVLRREFPEAKWVGGFALHKPTPSVEHVWIELEEEGEDRRNWARALVDAVNSPPPSASTATTTTLVFARTAGAAAEAAERLRSSGIDALEYSSSVPLESRRRALEALRGGRSEKCETKSVVVVATDAAARGLDLGSSSRGVDHVVQADFAANAVDWLHRVGRTGRGLGSSSPARSSPRQTSKVTSLVSPADAALAGAIRGALEAGSPVDGSFSRNRSFRNKMKKYGEYVPRGEVYKGGGGGGGGGGGRGRVGR